MTRCRHRNQAQLSVHSDNVMRSNLLQSVAPAVDDSVAIRQAPAAECVPLARDDVRLTLDDATTMAFATPNNKRGRTDAVRAAMPAPRLRVLRFESGFCDLDRRLSSPPSVDQLDDDSGRRSERTAFDEVLRTHHRIEASRPALSHRIFLLRVDCSRRRKNEANEGERRRRFQAMGCRFFANSGQHAEPALGNDGQRRHVLTTE